MLAKRISLVFECTALDGCPYKIGTCIDEEGVCKYLRAKKRR